MDYHENWRDTNEFGFIYHRNSASGQKKTNCDNVPVPASPKGHELRDKSDKLLVPITGRGNLEMGLEPMWRAVSVEFNEHACNSNHDTNSINSSEYDDKNTFNYFCYEQTFRWDYNRSATWASCSAAVSENLLLVTRNHWRLWLAAIARAKATAALSPKLLKDKSSRCSLPSKTKQVNELVSSSRGANQAK